MTSSESYTAEALLDFLKQAGMEGLINPATARARRKALEQLAGELTEQERRDIRSINVDDLLSRFHKLEGLVVLQPDNSGFSWPVSVQGKARLAVNGCLPLQEPERCHGR